jgi:hypothetical protein
MLYDPACWQVVFVYQDHCFHTAHFTGTLGL